MDAIMCKTAISLISYVLGGRRDQISPDIDFEKLYDFSVKHGVENIVYVGLRELNIEVPDEVMEKFIEANDMSIVAEATQAIELEELSEKLDKRGIDHIPLKGSVVKYLYPMPDYRKSGDIDILIRQSDEPEVRSIMEESGYIGIDDFEGHDIHIAFRKPPLLTVEIHRLLVRQGIRAYEFCKGVWDYAFPDESCKHCYKMTNEFFYTYMLAHLCKHLYTGGAGIRLISDIWIMKRNMNIDEHKLADCLEKARLTELERMINGLVKKWFGEGYETDTDVELIEKIVFESGSFGSEATHSLIRSYDAKGTKLKRIWGMIFPKPSTMYAKYPILKKHKSAVVFIWIKRGIEIMLGRHGSIDAAIKHQMGSNSNGTNISNIINAIR